VTVLLHGADLEARRHAAMGPLRDLADSLARDLEPVLARDLFVPPEKARMTRRGGRCENDGTLLEFDPWSPRVHRCPACGAVFDDETHYRWWIMWYQLWLAERAVHAATLFARRGAPRHAELATSVLGAYTDRYLAYPNTDNVLGPTRVFFSTYLESIWLLQLIVALDLLEIANAPAAAALGARARERLVDPSARLIASYDEGLSNRQVWNNAALLGASRLLHRRVDESALRGPSGLLRHLTSGLLGDGTWYEGENYHLFAHRGLWYGVTIATTAGVGIDPALVARFDEAFATPFITALPDFTFPSRRDSQYRVSLRQWRFAELAELGFARRPSDDRLSGALATLYDGSVARGDTGRAQSTAEAERNTPAVGLDRSDLGWRSLLFASPTLPPLAASRPRSALLAEQGYAILRRDSGALYAALDYGHSGAGHGHPDRLNFVLVNGTDRWLDDVGTGSYVDPSLHWYRSTLAHNAPLVDGHSQERVHGVLVAYDEHGDAGWVRAAVDGVAPGIRFERAIVAMPEYVIDELTWQADREVQVDLPFHADGELAGVGPWSSADPRGGTGNEDGFRFLTGGETATPHGDVRLHARLGGSTATARVIVDHESAWWRATAYGPPGSGPRRFHFVRVLGSRGRILTVWDVHGSVRSVERLGDGVVVHVSGAERHEHHSGRERWRVSVRGRGGASTIELGGTVHARSSDAPRAPLRGQPFVIPVAPSSEPAARALTFDLGEQQYRRSEHAWAEAAKPAATVSLWADDHELVIVVDVRKTDIHFAPRRNDNPLDNEHPDTNSDGVQLHLIVPGVLATAPDKRRPRELTWLMVPEPERPEVRVTARASDGAAPAIRAAWQQTPQGYSMRIAVPLADLGVDDSNPFKLGLVVNDMAAGRERRRGQLVLGGRSGEFVYLRGDRLAADELLDVLIASRS
jgi:hypothetical protein